MPPCFFPCLLLSLGFSDAIICLNHNLDSLTVIFYAPNFVRMQQNISLINKKKMGSLVFSQTWLKQAIID